MRFVARLAAPPQLVDDAAAPHLASSIGKAVVFLAGDPKYPFEKVACIFDSNIAIKVATSVGQLRITGSTVVKDLQTCLDVGQEPSPEQMGEYVLCIERGMVRLVAHAERARHRWHC